MADILNKRNKVHHLDANTDEDMFPIFEKDVDYGWWNDIGHVTMVIHFGDLQFGIGHELSNSSQMYVPPEMVSR